MSIPMTHFVPFVSLSAEERSLVQRVYRVQQRTKLKVQVVYSDCGLLDHALITGWRATNSLPNVDNTGQWAHNGMGMFREVSRTVPQTNGEDVQYSYELEGEPVDAPHLLTEDELRLFRIYEGKLAMFAATRCAYRVGGRVMLWRFIPRPFSWNTAVRFLELDAISNDDQGALVLLDWALEQGIASAEHVQRIARHFGKVSDVAKSIQFSVGKHEEIPSDA